MLLFLHKTNDYSESKLKIYDITSARLGNEIIQGIELNRGSTHVIVRIKGPLTYTTVVMSWQTMGQ